MLDRSRAAAIRILALDVDGVLTDNAIFIGSVDGKRVEFKRFDIQDGLGITLLRSTDLEVILVSGRHSDATSLRASELGIVTALQVHPGRKVAEIETVLAERQLDWSAVAFVGDDLADLAAMERAGLAIAVANARDEVKAVAHAITEARGGHGAVAGTGAAGAGAVGAGRRADDGLGVRPGERPQARGQLQVAACDGAVQQELTPEEDRSVALMRVTGPPGVSLDYMRQQVMRVEQHLQPLIESGEIRNLFSISGQGSTNSALCSGYSVSLSARAAA